MDKDSMPNAITEIRIISERVTIKAKPRALRGELSSDGQAKEEREWCLICKYISMFSLKKDKPEVASRMKMKSLVGRRKHDENTNF